MSKPIVILCEDAAQQDFLRRLLKRRGHSNRDIDPGKPPTGRGAADRHVLSQYPRQVGSLRAESQYRRRCLVVAVDADRHSVDQRYRHLDEALRDCQKLRDERRRPRQADEHIAIFVPKWHIETWVDYLLEGGLVSEDAPSPRHGRCEPHECQDAADRFLDLGGKRPLPADCPPSLTRGLEDELPRIPRADA